MKVFVARLIFIGSMIGGIYLFTNQRQDYGFNPSEFSDTLADAGFEISSHVDEQALLQTRKLVTTTDLNAVLSRNIIRELILLNSRSAELPIDLYIRTEGGWEADVFAIIDTMHSLEAPVNIHGLGEVHSAGCMLLAAATGKRIVYENTVLGFHTLEEGDEEIFMDRYIAFWETVAEIPEEWLERRDDEMIYFTPADALKYKIVDEIISSKK